MSWQCDNRLSGQDYLTQDQRIAFRAGYSDAFHGATMWAGNDRSWHPDEYRAGFEFGTADREISISSEVDEAELKFSLQSITAAIYKLRADYTADGQYANYQAINAGGCEDFAEEIHGLIGSPQENSEYWMIDPSYFLQAPLDGENDNWGFPLDRDYLQTQFPSVVPPDGLDWDDLDHISAFGNFFSGTHVWIFANGRHYDAEAPDGVETPFDLPFFKRIVNRWIAEGKPEANPLPAPTI